MNRKTIAITPPARLLLFAGLALTLLCTASQAQLRVDMQLNKKNYVNHEPIMATVRVRNLSGQDIILGGGPRGGSPINFDIRRGSHGMSLRPDAPVDRPRALKANASYETTINLGRYYPLAMPANYAVTASVYYPALKRDYSSNRMVINVLKAKTLWMQEFGIAKGDGRPNEFRKYSLLSFRDRNESNLYIRVASLDGESVFATYSLGRVLRSFNPEVDVDAANRLHVLHLGGPQFYAYSIIDTNGRIVGGEQKYFKEVNGSRPSMRNQGGTIVVRGGVETDRHGLAGTPQALPTAPRANPPGTPRRASERPVGLPLPR